MQRQINVLNLSEVHYKMNFLLKKIPYSLEIMYRIIVMLALAIFTMISSALYVAWLVEDLDTIIKLLIPLGVLLSAGLAAMSVFMGIKNSNKIEKEKKEFEISEFYLNNSLVELNNVYKILKDKNNDRVTWLLAARVLKLSFELSENITDQNHKKVYELQKFQIRHNISDVFTKDGALEIRFFSGLRMNGPILESKIEHEVNGVSSRNRLSEESVYIIFSFLEYEDSFDDPIEDIQLPTTEDELDIWKLKGNISDTKQSASEYIKIRKQL